MSSHKMLEVSGLQSPRNSRGHIAGRSHCREVTLSGGHTPGRSQARRSHCLETTLSSGFGTLGCKEQEGKSDHSTGQAQ